ncbi:RagB/SusD family nutrient uptake outer membrane protein [Sphingobacterium yanglingense]|uniref:SusD-like starch-binding protein associating with outer membrane n=1 Tax=Sphingobacterium yanglingense TaxID=1437280 RepID=A0A4R6W7Q9_9SPHI|nr:RagB/SusD family nutrient uptake outer membrane protein [Sphingobacterium yanglingense]TDQ73451.1 SusD-like starch-binding protein associating with outer membrane [Sphingobacterium yanglingense]
MRYLYIGLLVAAGLLQSCEGFLEEEPKYTLTDKNSVTDYDKAKAAVGGIYSKFQNDEWAGKLYLAQGSKSGIYGVFDQEYKMSYREEAFTNNTIWFGFYTALNAANFAIKGVEDLDVNKFPSAEAKENLVAEARALRGWINLNILWNFGHWWAEDASEYGLIYRAEAADLGNVQQPRISVGESYQRIMEDLDYAITHGAAFKTPRYVSKQFAQAIKAKLLLYRGTALGNNAMLTESLNLVNAVMQESPSTFAMEAKLEDVYAKAWDSNEVLFARYLENNGARTTYAGHNYPYGLVYAGNRLPLGVGGELNAGLKYGADWFKSDPRWPLITGNVRSPEPWDETFCFAFKKLTRLGKVGGLEANPVDEKYAVYYFRYPELYLMKSELLARTGASIAESLAPINQMRAKRVSPVLPALHATSKDELMDVIFKEIVKETFLENGSEFFASLRFMKDGKPYIETIKDDVQFEQNRVCYPIPKDEILSNKLIKQNPELK